MKINLKPPIDLCKVMRITLSQLFIAFVFSGVALAGTTKAQAVLDSAVDLTVKDMSLDHALRTLEKQLPVKFVYSKTLIETDQTVSANFHNRKLSLVLDNLLTPMGISYRLVNGMIVLSRLRTTLSTIQGKVTDSTGTPMPGVTVLLKNSNKGATTDANGNYSLQVDDLNGILVFKLIGYQTQEIAVNGRTIINVSITIETSGLQEVIVIGYGTTTRQNITTAVSKVDPKKIPTAANNSIPDLLFGRAAGLQVTQQSSQPGGNIDISIRGKGTPLIIVDGVVYPNSGLEPTNGVSTELQGVNRGLLAGLNPNDIESIEFLKDASAAIYGVSASNGVMLITTKKGKAGRMSVTYDGSRSYVRNMHYLEPLNAHDYMQYFNELNKDKYLSDRNMAPFGTVATDLSGYTAKFSDDQVAKAGVGTKWLDQVFRSGSVDNHMLSINGGSDKVTYYFSGSYFNQQGTLKESGLVKYAGRMNMSFKLNKVIQFNAGLNANRNNYQNPQAGWQNGGSGTQGFNALQAALAYPSYVPVRDATGKYSIFANTGNPVSLFDIQDNTLYQAMLANLSADITIIPGVLTGKVLYGNNSEYSNRGFYIPVSVYYGQLYKSRAALVENRRQNQTEEATLSFKKSFGKVLKVDAVTGVGQYLEDYTGFSVETSNILDPINLDNLASATGPKTIGSYRGVNKLRSFFIRSNFDFYDKYVVALTLRRDGADKFFPDNKYQNFPSISVGWKISNEAFFHKGSFVELLKLRASYGTTGDRPGSAAYGSYGPDANAVTFDNGATIYFPYKQTAFTNPGLQWPIVKTFDIGLDFSFIKDRISGSFDWYNENKERLLINATTPQLSLISTSPINGGHQRRKGFEFSLNTVNIQHKNFSWNSTFNVTHFENRWVERFPNDAVRQYEHLDDLVASSPSGNTYPSQVIYVYKTDGILQANAAVPAWQPTGATKPGSPIFVDRNGDKILDYHDVVGYSAIPKAVIGLGNNFTYKNFDLAIFLYGQYGAWGYDYTTLWGDPVNLLSLNQSGTTRIKQAWSTSNPGGTLPGAAYNETAIALDAGIDSRLVKKDFLRCRNITLGYTVNTKVVHSLKVYVDVQNAFIITGFKGVDPELQAASIKGGPAPYPMIRTFSFGVKAGF
ncbi:TonB-linked outer membrane protein, SusC/RagA family [Chitinophaga sp. YR573]|nr:TonB-linked outer membrane protein, SusC/RagA family [Chitinophaga sp. YR573]